LIYHVLNRGVARQDLFEDAGDYAAFLRVLAEPLAAEPGVRLLAVPRHAQPPAPCPLPRADGACGGFCRRETAFPQFPADFAAFFGTMSAIPDWRHAATGVSRIPGASR
jgi:hypothetical protein